MLSKQNLLKKGAQLAGWHGEEVVDLGDVKARLFHLTSDKEMLIYEEGHSINEWILVLQGEILVETENRGNIILEAGDSFMVPPGTNHRLNVKNDAIGLITRDMKIAPQHFIPNAIQDKNR